MTAFPADTTTLRHWWKLLRQCTRECEERLKDQYQLDLRTYFMLQVISEQTPTPMHLASELHLSRPQVSRLLEEVSKQGWITVQRDPRDGRSRQVTLTPAGQDHLQQVTLHLLDWLSGQHPEGAAAG